MPGLTLKQGILFQFEENSVVVDRKLRFQGAVFGAVARLCDGARTDEEVVEWLAETYAREVVWYAILSLRKHGCLDEVEMRALPEPALDGLRGLSIVRSLRSVPGDVVRSAAYEARIDCERPTMARGRGVTEAQAMLGCFAEAVERYCLLAAGLEASNGCAAGATREDAERRGLLELIERDAIAGWWEAGKARPRVELASFGDAFLSAAAERVCVLDLGGEWGVPVFAAVAVEALGFGAAEDARGAARRAILEMNQIAGAMKWSGGELGLRIEERPQLRASGEMLSAGNYVGLKRAPIGYRVEDLTREEMPLPVVRVVAEGLRSLWGLKDFPL